MEVAFATSNPHKLKEANTVGESYGVSFRQIGIDYPEIRADEVTTVAEEGARYCFEKTGQPVVVDDTGLYIEALNGFPGAYSAYVFSKIGCKGILRLLINSPERRAYFVSAVGYCDTNGVKVFKGVVSGSITEDINGPEIFGYDPIFVPEGSAKTFAEDLNNKDQVSHRRKSFEQFCRWITSKEPY